MRRFRQPRESGQVAVLAIVFLGVLLGICGAVLDVGSWYRADRALELPDDPGAAAVLAEEYAEKNGGGLESVAVTGQVLANDTIVVSGTRSAPGFFTKIFGVDEVQVRAGAKARTGTLANARWAAPFGVDERHPMLQCRCFDTDTELDLEKTGPGAFRVLNIDGSRGGVGPQILGDWIERGYEGYMPLGWYYSDPGTRFNSNNVRDALDARLDTEMLFPVYRATRGQGAGFDYEVVGWAGYVVTSYEIQGSKRNKLHGYFTTVVWEGIGSETADSPDFGARALSLVE